MLSAGRTAAPPTIGVPLGFPAELSPAGNADAVSLAAHLPDDEDAPTGHQAVGDDDVILIPMGPPVPRETWRPPPLIAGPMNAAGQGGGASNSSGAGAPPSSGGRRPKERSGAPSRPDAAIEAARSRLDVVMKGLEEMDGADAHDVRVRLAIMESLEQQVYGPDGRAIVDITTLERGALVSMNPDEYLYAKGGLAASRGLHSLGDSFRKRPLASNAQLKKLLRRSDLNVDRNMRSRGIQQPSYAEVFEDGMRGNLIDMETIRIHALRRQIDPRAAPFVRGWANLERDMAERIALLRALFDKLGVPLRP